MSSSSTLSNVITGLGLSIIAGALWLLYWFLSVIVALLFWSWLFGNIAEEYIKYKREQNKKY